MEESSSILDRRPPTRRPHAAPSRDSWSPIFLRTPTPAAPSEALRDEERMDRARRQILDAAEGAGGRSGRRQEYHRLRQGVLLANLGLVARIARRYEKMGLPREDLVQEGMLGMLRATEFYDGGRGFRFVTYAKWWVKQSILSAVALLAGPCRIPVPVLVSLSRIRATARTLTQALGRAPSLSDLATAAGMTRRAAIRARSWQRGAFSRIGSDPLPLLAAKPSRSGATEGLEQKLHSALNQIGERERGILESRFGLRGRPERTCREIGGPLGISGERIRQIEKGALQRLRGILESRGGSFEQLAD